MAEHGGIGVEAQCLQNACGFEAPIGPPVNSTGRSDVELGEAVRLTFDVRPLRLTEQNLGDDLMEATWHNERH